MAASPAISIRSAAKADVPLILHMIGELAEYEKLSQEVVATAEGLEVSLFGPRCYAEVLIAECDKEAAGFCLFFHNYSTFLGKPGVYVEDVFVRPAWRGRGIGKAFFARIGEIARERGCGRIEWWVLDWNAPAIAFYRRMGARAMDEWTVYRLTEAQFESL